VRGPLLVGGRVDVSEAGLFPRVPRELVLSVGGAMTPIYRDLLTRALDSLAAADRATIQTPPIH
jgi:hypothetical protein